MPEAIAAGGHVRPESRIVANAFHPGSNFVVDKFAGVQNSVWIERLLEPTMKITRHITRRFRPPPFFCQTDSVFACDHAAPRQHLRKKIVERALDPFTHTSVAVVAVCHDVDVNVSVPGVAKARNRESMLRL